MAEKIMNLKNRLGKLEEKIKPTEKVLSKEQFEEYLKTVADRNYVVPEKYQIKEPFDLTPEQFEELKKLVKGRPITDILDDFD